MSKSHVSESSSAAHAPVVTLSSALTEYALGRHCQKAIQGVLLQVHPRLSIGEAAMYPIQQFLRTLMWRLAHMNIAPDEAATASVTITVSHHTNNGTDEQSKSPSPPTCETVFTPGALIKTKEQLLTRVQQVLAGQCVKHAILDAEKACTKYAAAMRIDVDQIDGAPLAPWSDDEIRHESGLVFPLLSYSLWPLTVRLMMAAVVEYMAAEIIELGGRRTKRLGRTCILARDVAFAIERDPELLCVARSWGLDLSMAAASAPDGRTPEQRLANLFPHTQIQLRELNRYAWYNHPAQVESVLTKFISGELPQGDTELKEFHLRPVAHFGRNHEPIRFELDDDDIDSDFDDDDDDDNNGYSNASPMDRAFDLFAFDLIDAAGREYPLLVEFRMDRRDVGFYLTVGRVMDRVTSACVCEIESTEEWWDQLRLVTAGKTLRNYAPHEVTIESFEGALGRIVPESGEQSQDLKMTRTWEIELLICAAIHLIGGWGSEESLPSLSQFQSMHPPAVITRFTRALYRTAFDSPQVRSTLRDDFHLPNDLLNVIGDYAPVDLPYIPLDPALGKAPLAARTGSNSAISAGIPSTSAKRSAAEAELADHTVTAAAPIPDDGSHSADGDSDSDAPPPNRKQKSTPTRTGQNLTEDQTGGTVTVTDSTQSTSTSVTAAASSSSVSGSVIAPTASVIYPKDKWTELVPPDDLSSRFIASNGRSFNFWAMIEDTLSPTKSHR